MPMKKCIVFYVAVIFTICNSLFVHAQNSIDYSKAYVQIVHALSTEAVDYAPSIGPDGKTILFVSSREGSVLSEQTYDEKGKPKPRYTSHDIWQSEIKGDTFTVPTPITPINTSLNEGTMVFGKDMQHLFFTACNNRNCYGACDIFHFNFEDTTWVIRNAGPNVSTKYWDSQPGYGKNGTLYYVSTTPIGSNPQYENFDIFASELDSAKNSYLPAQRLGSEINTKDRESAPFYSFYEDALYFSSNGHQPNYGGLDLYKAKRNPDGSWQKPENLGQNINSKDDDFFITISRDGKYILFSSTRESEFGKKDMNIYRIIVPK